MSKLSRSCLLIVVAVFLVTAQPVKAADRPPGNLVQPEWLARHLTDPAVLVLDASPAQAYAANHIPGAVNADVFANLIKYGVGDTPVAETEQVFQSWGLSRGKTVVVYDQGGSMMATRLFFSLVHHGFPAKDLAVLDGGLARWQQKALPLTKEATSPAKGSFKIAKLDDAVRVHLPEFLTASGDPAANALVDALGSDWFYGQTHPFDRAGHIPNAVMLPSEDFYNADKTFKSPDEIRTMLRYVGVRPEQRIYTYCGGGVAASVPFFAIKYLAGYPNVKLFSESELGWLSDDRQLPLWTYDEPFLARDANWLQWWGGQRLRTYLGPRVSIIDVRPPDAYAKGHIAFALNIPAELFRQNVATPAKLAEALGPAGVDINHEAVVVSGAGVTPDAALAFAMLEQLGQKRTAVLVDSLDQWTKLGLALKTDPTAVGAKKAARDLVIEPTNYAPAAGHAVVVGDATTPKGLYPRVFIASGKELPAKARDGKVVHVPYTELLDAAGQPKAAKDIWTVLTKAGVPRYAELVCVADDPGEAAANYFVLRLMGYPDVKVGI